MDVHVGRPHVVVTVVEDGVVDGIPSQFCAVLAVVEAGFGCGFGEEVGLVLWRAGQVPRCRQPQVDGRFGAFEVVDVGSAGFAGRPGEAWDETGKFAVDAYPRRSLGANAWQGVDEGGQPTGFGVVAQVGAIDGVGDGFLAVVDFLRVGTLAQIKHGAAQAEVGVELVLNAGAQEGLLQGTETRVGL